MSGRGSRRRTRVPRLPLRARKPKEVLDLGRLPLFVDAKQRDIQAVPRILEVVRIATEESGCGFRRPDQAHIRVLPVTIQVIPRSTVQRDDVTAQSGLVQRFLFNLRHHLPPCSKCIGRLHRIGDSGRHSLRNVLDRNQLIQFQIRRWNFVGGTFRKEAISQVVLLRRGDLLQSIRSHVMVCQYEPGAGNKGSRSTRIETDRREHHLAYPRIVRFKAVFAAQIIPGQVVKQPHPFIRGGKRAAGANQEERHPTGSVAVH